MTKDSTTTPDKNSTSGIKRLVVFAISSLSSTAIDAAIFAFVFAVTKDKLGDFATVVATIVARICSSFYNFNVNRAAVFKDKSSYFPALIRYYSLCIPQMIVSATFVTIINSAFKNSATIYATIIKVCVDTILFFISYFIQKKWVFKKRK